MRRFLAGLLALVFILGFAVDAIGWAALDALFAPDTYAAIIRNPEFANVAVVMVRDEVADRILDEASDLGSLFTRDDARWMAEQLITGPWLTGQMERWLGALFDWVKTDAPQPALIVSVVELKQEALAIVETLVAEKLRQLPVCTLERVAQALEALLSGREVLLCLPPNFDVDGFVRSDILNLRGRVANQMQSLPDRVDLLALAEEVEDGGSLLSALDQMRLAWQRARRYLTLLGAALLGVFLLIGILRWQPKRALLQWWGWTLLLAGGAALLGMGMVYGARIALWQWVATSPTGVLPPDLSQMARAAFEGILTAVRARALLLGGVAALTGLLLVALSFALPRGASSGGRAS